LDSIVYDIVNDVSRSIRGDIDEGVVVIVIHNKFYFRIIKCKRNMRRYILCDSANRNVHPMWNAPPM
jgi:hypothetical protein